MSNYVVTTSFAPKDALPSGNPSKIAKGAEIGAEFTNIATAIATKEDTANKNAASGYAGLDASSKVTATLATAAQIPNLAATQITSGVFANAQIQQSNVTQHQAALSIATSQITGGFAASVITSGTFADARIASSNVTQYQASLSIAWSQITGTKNADQLQGNAASAFAAVSHTHAATDIVSGTIANARLPNIASMPGVTIASDPGGTPTGSAGQMWFYY